ncbi:MAG: hypothetical protein NC548_06490 [Lachnospiraceae bacterium]|nr:hypothetical protein [Lachnospiraceae bacterium]
MMTKAYVEHDILHKHIYGSFCKAYCYTLPFDAYRKLSGVLSHVMEWLQAANLSENGGMDGPYVRAIVPTVVSAIVKGFEDSKDYAEIRKNFGVDYKSLIKLDEVLTAELENQYEKPAIAVRGGVDGQESGKITYPGLKD